MATIVKHPDVEDYFVQLTLDEVRNRPDGLTQDYERGRLLILKDYRLPVDLDAFAQMSSQLTSAVDNQPWRKRLKKLVATTFFETGPGQDDVRTALLEELCRGDRQVFERAREEMKRVHETALELYRICFPRYQEQARLIPSLRLTQTLFENLHWDNHQIDDDFQQARIFANLDLRPRIWNVSHNFITYAREIYREHDLGRFAGKDPNSLIEYMVGAVLGGRSNACCDLLPRHAVAFEPGEVWFAESRLISHQIVYGERAMVYMLFARPEAMLDPDRRFNARVDALHREFARIPA